MNRKTPESESPEGVSAYLRYNRRQTYVLIFLTAVLVVLGLKSIATGSMNITFTEVIGILLNGGTGTEGIVVWHLRLPRVVAAILAGAALGVAGTVMQCVLRNPLGSPFTLGISNAAAFGAAVGIILLGGGAVVGTTNAIISVNNPYLVTICAFTFSMVATAVMIILVKVTNVTPEAMVLAGIALGSLFSAGLAALQYFSDDTTISSIVYWQFGNLGKITWNHNLIIFIALTIVVTYFIIKRWDYNALDAGEDVAKGLGINTERTRVIGMVASSAITAVVVSFAGIIGFIGLVAPHMVRRIVGNDHRFLLPGSMLVGSLILLASDTVGRSMFAFTIPVGIITAFIGAPLFLYLLIRGYRRDA